MRWCLSMIDFEDLINSLDKRIVDIFTRGYILDNLYLFVIHREYFTIKDEILEISSISDFDRLNEQKTVIIDNKLRIKFNSYLLKYYEGKCCEIEHLYHPELLYGYVEFFKTLQKTVYIRASF